MINEINETTKTILDGFSLTAAIGAVVGIIPQLAALASLVWTAIRIYEWHKDKKEKTDADKRINRLDS